MAAAMSNNKDVDSEGNPLSKDGIEIKKVYALLSYDIMVHRNMIAVLEARIKNLEIKNLTNKYDE